MSTDAAECLRCVQSKGPPALAIVDFWRPYVAAPAPARESPVHPVDLGLTERLGEVLAMVPCGLPNKRIARELGLSEPTVKAHVTRMLARPGVSNRIQTIQLLRGRRIAP